MISQERFNEIQLEHGCGYWFECCDRACPCAITTENKGLRQDIWDDFKKEQRELAEEYDNDDFEYEPMARCKECGSWENEDDLTDGMCADCYDECLEDHEEDEDCDGDCEICDIRELCIDNDC